MLLSMTGFGEARLQEGALTVAIEIRTINNRYLKLAVRSSEQDSSTESRIEQVIRKHIRRGTVQVQLQFEREHAADDYRINADVLDSYRQQLMSLHTRWHLTETVALESLIQLPGVIEDQVALHADLSADWPLIERTLRAAIDELAKTRAKEGQAMAEDLAANCRTIGEQLSAIEAAIPEVIEQYRARLADRVEKSLSKHEVSLDAADLVREVALVADRSDVSEEVVRLKSHLVQFEKTMELPESAGRRLDFITQEMFREANTIGSKAIDVEIPKHVVEIKTAIERMREQVQNIE